jgi:integrase
MLPPDELRNRIDELRDSLDEYAVASPSRPGSSPQPAANTLRQYAHDLANFRRWVADTLPDAPPWPEPEIVAKYLSEMFIVRGLAGSSVSRRATGIAHGYREAGEEPHLRRHPAVERLLTHIKEVDRPPKRRHAWLITVQELRRLVPAPTRSEPADIRDRAIMLTAFASGLVPRQLAALDLEHVHPTDEGVVLDTPRVDGTGERKLMGMKPAEIELDLCPVVALRRWAGLLEDAPGPLFRAVRPTPSRSSHPARLTTRHLEAMVRRRVREADLPSPELFKLSALTRPHSAAVEARIRSIQWQTRADPARVRLDFDRAEPHDASVRVL